MSETSEKIKLDDYMSTNGLTKEEVFQAISRKEISGSFVGGDWYIEDDRDGSNQVRVEHDPDEKPDKEAESRMAREKEEALAQIAMAQTMAKSAQAKARKTKGKASTKKSSSSTASSAPPNKKKEKPKDDSESSKRSPRSKLSLKDSGMAESILAEARELALGPQGKSGGGSAKGKTAKSQAKTESDKPRERGPLSLKDSGMAESILAEARELALGPQGKAVGEKTDDGTSSLAASILEEARDLARLQDSIANTKFSPPLGSSDSKPERSQTTPKLVARQFEDQLVEEDGDEEEEERWKTKLDQYVVDKGITLDEAYQLITTKQINGQFIGGEWYVIDSDEEHELRKRDAAAGAALAERQRQAEEKRQEAIRREGARRRIKIGEYMFDKGLSKEEVFKRIQDKSIEGSFENGEWYVLESEEDLLAREETIALQQEAIAAEEIAREEAYKERRHEADLQDGLNEEERARALNMPYITDAKFADRTILKTIGVAQGSTVRSKNVPPELSKEGATMPGAELVAFTAELVDARAQAIDRMRIDAFLKGANAVVSTQFSTSMIDIGAIEIMVYGTAVVVSMAS